jgi:hypothetical protein
MFHLFQSSCFFVGAYFGGGGSVRRRNTLHVVGGRQLSLSQARFMGREKILLYKIRFYIIKCKMLNIIKDEKTLKYP